MKTLRIGVTGYSLQKFDEEAAGFMLKAAFQYLKMQHRAENVDIVSGLTNLGVPAVAYQIARDLEFTTTGIACVLAKEYKCFPVDQEVIVGEQWGEESETFLNSIDVLVRVGGGKQAIRETKLASSKGIPTMEFDLPPLEDNTK